MSVPAHPEYVAELIASYPAGRSYRCRTILDGREAQFTIPISGELGDEDLTALFLDACDDLRRTET